MFFFSVALLFSLYYSNSELLKSDNIIFFFVVFSLCCLKTSNSNWSHADLSIRYGFHHPIIVQRDCSSIFFLRVRIEIIIDYAQCCLPMTPQTSISVFLFIQSKEKSENRKNKRNKEMDVVNIFGFALMLLFACFLCEHIHKIQPFFGGLCNVFLICHWAIGLIDRSMILFGNRQSFILINCLMFCPT